MSGSGDPAPRPDAAVEQDVRAEVAGMWERFREPFSAQVAILEEAAMAVLSANLDPATADRALREAHKLAGSLATFGMPRGSEIARELESWFRSPPEHDPAEVLRLSDRVVSLRHCLDAGPGPDLAAAPARTGNGSEDRFLLLVDDDALLADGLRREASRHRLGLVVVDGVDAARQLLTTHRPDALLIDLARWAPEAVFGLMREIKARPPPVPVVVLTPAGTFTDRVEAARLGGRGFLRKPVTPAEIMIAVSEILQRARVGEATVLAVDDDPAVLAALASLLEHQGWRVVTLDEPSRFWEVLTDTAPELVILDVEMPQVSGVEMCEVMRADQRWSRVPVVFLTARTDSATVQSIFAAGADDYVPKPLVGPELTTRIANRIERTRLLRRIAETDPLTGVANQAAFAGATEHLLGTGDRFGRPVAVAVIDVDRMRAVNDRFGYGAGDEVLARLGHLLLESFPGDDVVGRRAGQEFFVAMPGMTRGDGVQRLAEVLEQLRWQRFSDDHGASFRASFSAGVAQHPDDGADLRSLYRASDGALRRAKEAGGDRVVPAGWSTGDDVAADVVLVEDDDALASVLLHGLTTRAYRTRRFDDGQEAANALQGPTPKVSARVVLLDWGLPSLDGLRVLRRLADTGVLGRTRVIMLTVRDSESEVLQALDLGAFDHVAKPFSVPILMKRVHRAMEWRT